MAVLRIQLAKAIPRSPACCSITSPISRGRIFLRRNFNDIGTFERGVAQYVPTWGEKGLLVSVGGNQVSSSNPSEGNHYPWNNVTIFHPATREWYAQPTSGDGPSSRERFCYVGISSSTNDTYEIFVYGGNPLDQQNIAQEASTVYILTLPAFVWFRIRLPTSDPRYFQTCNIAGNRQMLSVGGLDPSLNNTPIANGTSEQINATDPFALGVKIFDLTQLNWTDSFDPKAAAYEAPKVVEDYYSTNARYPQRWNDDRVKDIFTKSRQTSSPSPSASSQSSRHGASKSHKGVIAGGVVGGVAGFALLGAIAWTLVRRKRKPEPTSNSQPDAVEIHDAQRSELDVAGMKQRHELTATERHELGPGTTLGRPGELPSDN